MTGLKERTRDDKGRYLAEYGEERIRGGYVVEDRGFDTPCWIWTRSISSEGYARLNGEYVHRLMCRDKPPAGSRMHVDHLCRQRACINPAHLELVTNGENIRRAYTHCKHGHKFTPENTYLRPDSGTRQCRICIRERPKRREERMAA